MLARLPGVVPTAPEHRRACSRPCLYPGDLFWVSSWSHPGDHPSPTHALPLTGPHQSLWVTQPPGERKLGDSPNDIRTATPGQLPRRDPTGSRHASARTFSNRGASGSHNIAPASSSSSPACSPSSERGSTLSGFSSGSYPKLSSEPSTATPRTFLTGEDSGEADEGPLTSQVATGRDHPPPKSGRAQYFFPYPAPTQSSIPMLTLPHPMLKYYQTIPPRPDNQIRAGHQEGEIQGDGSENEE